VLAGASAVLFWIWIGFHFSLQLAGTPVTYERYSLYTCVLVAALGLDFIVSKLHDTDLLQLDLIGVLRLSLRQVMTILGVFLLFLVAQKDTSVSRVFLFSFIPILYFSLLTLNRICPRFLATTLFQTSRREGTLLVGSPAQARRMMGWVQSKMSYGVDIVGLISDEPVTTPGIPWDVVGGTKDLEQIIKTTGASQVIALQMPNSISRAARMGKLCEQLGVRLLIVNDIEERFSRPVYFFEDSGVRFFSLREEPLECPFNRLLKRALDIALALPVVVFILPPLCLLVHLMQRTQSPGPLFFRQRRTGIRLRGFQIYKFRTMRLDNGDESEQATEADPRVFPLGRWLRRLSIDELPQFINVLQGEMSVVGPRPHMIEHDSLFEKVADFYRMRSFVKPGITGLAQVQGFRGEARRAEDVVGRVKSDVYYLEHWSLGLDWKIIFQTAWQMVRPPKTAY
jgi:exopolysaccharide biosynthesis polyprenyl glycosylphosphotransferase